MLMETKINYIDGNNVSLLEDPHGSISIGKQQEEKVYLDFDSQRYVNIVLNVNVSSAGMTL